MASDYKLKLKQGDTFRRQYGYRLLRRDANGTPVRDAVTRQPVYDPVDLTGWTGRMQVREDINIAPVVDITQVVNAQGSLTFGNGFFIVNLVPAATSLIESAMLFGIRATNPAGDVFTLWEGLTDVELAVVQ